MPVEIKELHIKAIINQGGQQGGQTTGTTNSKTSENVDLPDKEDIIAECVEKILAILKEKNER